MSIFENAPEQFLVPGDFVHHEIAFETDVWQGKPVKPPRPSIQTYVEDEKQANPVQFGQDDTIHKISKALGSLVTKELGKVVSNKELLQRPIAPAPIVKS